MYRHGYMNVTRTHQQSLAHALMHLQGWASDSLLVIWPLAVPAPWLVAWLFRLRDVAQSDILTSEDL